MIQDGYDAFRHPTCPILQGHGPRQRRVRGPEILEGLLEHRDVDFSCGATFQDDCDELGKVKQASR